MFPMAYIKQKCKKTKLASTLWYNTYKYTAYVKKKNVKCSGGRVILKITIAMAPFITKLSLTLIQSHS